jgi:SSS family solute:Na+ symporter
VALGALGLAAVFSAEVSSADAILFMLSTSLSQDLYRRFVNPGARDALVLKVARLAAVGGGALGVTLAIVSPTVIEALEIFYSLLSVSLFVPVVAGLHSRRAGVPEALAAIGAGVSVLLSVHLATGGRGFGYWSPVVAGLAAAGAGFGLVAVARIIGVSRRKEKTRAG